MHSISEWIKPDIEIEEFVQINQFQQTLNISIDEIEIAKQKYWQILSKLQQNQNQIILCTDGTQNNQSTAAAVNLTLFMKDYRDF